MRKNKTAPMLSAEEEARLQEKIASDPDNPELTDEQLAAMRPASDVLPPALYAALTRQRGRPKADVVKKEVKLRLDPEVVEAFKAAGPGWQTRMNVWLAKREVVTDLVVTYELAASEMRILLVQLKDPRSGLKALKPDQIKSIESVERQIALTENAALDVRKVLNEQAMFDTIRP